jgi:hypothetical protein
MTALELKPLTREVLAARAAHVRQAVIDAGWLVGDGPAIFNLLVCNGCGRSVDLDEEEPQKWSTAFAETPSHVHTDHGDVEIEGWIDFCPMCKLRRRLDHFRTAIRGSPPPA